MLGAHDVAPLKGIAPGAGRVCPPIFLPDELADWATQGSLTRS